MDTIANGQARRETPAPEWEELVHFRVIHPVKRITVGGTVWEYIATGRGPESLLILPGLLGSGETSFQHMGLLEREYRVIAPSYPATITGVTQLLDGLRGILDAEQIVQAHVLGESHGGLVAECLARRYPRRLGKLILAQVRPPTPEGARRDGKTAAGTRYLPEGIQRGLLRRAVKNSLGNGLAEGSFWREYSEMMIRRLDRSGLISRCKVAADLEAVSGLSTGDRRGWTGRTLILEDRDNPATQALRALYPQATVGAFHASGRAASPSSVVERVAAITRFLRED